MPTSARSAAVESSAPLDAQQRKYVRFDPTLNTGHVLQIVVLVVGGFAAYGALKSEAAQTKAELDQVKAVAIIERANTTMALAEIKIEMKEQGKTLGDLKEGIAILRGRAAEPRSSK